MVHEPLGTLNDIHPPIKYATGTDIQMFNKQEQVDGMPSTTSSSIKLFVYNTNINRITVYILVISGIKTWSSERVTD